MLHMADQEHSEQRTLNRSWYAAIVCWRAELSYQGTPQGQRQQAQSPVLKCLQVFLAVLLKMDQCLEGLPDCCLQNTHLD